jgi:DNA-binding transcriptional LysR family regulator
MQRSSEVIQGGERMDRWQAMKVFVKVAEAESFADAGRQLHMSPPAVTRVVSSLEDIIGTRLLTRTTRSVKLTESGNRYFTDCQRLLADLADAEAAAAGAFAKPTGTLSITASSMFGTMFVLPVVTEYLDEYPDVIGRCLFLDRVVNIVDEGIDVSIRIGHLPDSGFSAIRVGSVKRVICGSPDYFDRNGVPLTPSDLSRHRIVASTSAWSSLEWRFGSEQKTVVHVSPRLFTSTNEAAISTAVKGWGLTRVLSYQIAPELERGQLQTVLADYEEEPLPIHVVHPDGRHASAKVRSFVDFAVAKLRANRHFS